MCRRVWVLLGSAFNSAAFAKVNNTAAHKKKRKPKNNKKPKIRSTPRGSARAKGWAEMVRGLEQGKRKLVASASEINNNNKCWNKTKCKQLKWARAWRSGAPLPICNSKHRRAIGFRGGAAVAAAKGGAGMSPYSDEPPTSAFPIHLRVTLRRESASGDANCSLLVCKTSERSQTIYVEWRPLALSLRVPRSSVSSKSTHTHMHCEK